MAKTFIPYEKLEASLLEVNEISHRGRVLWADLWEMISPPRYTLTSF
jgi:hypothetical protein